MSTLMHHVALIHSDSTDHLRGRWDKFCLNQKLPPHLQRNFLIEPFVDAPQPFRRHTNDDSLPLHPSIIRWFQELYDILQLYQDVAERNDRVVEWAKSQIEKPDSLKLKTSSGAIKKENWSEIVVALERERQKHSAWTAMCALMDRIYGADWRIK